MLCLSRRELILGAAGSIPAGALKLQAGQIQFASPTASDLAVPLRARAAKKGLLYGAAASQRTLQANPAYAALFAAQCSLLVPEGELKWNVLRPTPDTFNFAPADWLLQFTQKNNIKFRGHTLIWWQALPGWFNSYVNQSNARQVLTDHIRKTVGRYSGKMHSWDVVNEVIDPYDKRPDGLQIKPWLSLAGPDYIDLAFETARETDKSAPLVWNENHLEVNDARSRAKRTAMISLLKEKLRRKVPIDAVGLQSHVSATDPSFRNHEFGAFLQQINDLGLKIIISELDVTDRDAPASIPHRDEAVAKTVYDVAHIALEKPNTVAILTWGLSDKYSWLVKFAPREDGLPVRPLPYDDSLNATPAWNALASAFDSATPRA